MNRPWMPLYVADYRADTAHLSAAQHGAYLLLIMHYWQTGKLPNDDAALSRIACMSTSEWKRTRAIVQTFFYGGWNHKRIDAELAKAADISSKRRASAEQRHSKRDANASPKAELLDTHTRATSLSQSHTQEEVSSLRSEARKRATRLPEEWVLSEEDFQFAGSCGLRLIEIEVERDKFRDHWKAKSGRDASKLDWSAAWRNWIRNVGNFNGKRQANTGSNLAFQLADEARELEREAGIHRSDDALGGH